MICENSEKDTEVGSQFPGWSPELGNRLRLIVSRLGGGVAAGEIAGVSDEAISRYINGKSKPSLYAVAALAHAAEVSLDWIVSTHGDSELPDNTIHKKVEDAGFVFIPRLEVQASAGSGREVVPVHQIAETVAFQESWLRKIGLVPQNAHVLTAIGDSMEPTIRDGDLLLVDRSIDRVRDNGIYVVVVAGMVFVKRLHVRMDGSLVLKSDNPMYPEETIQADDTADLHVAGRVRWFGRTI